MKTYNKLVRDRIVEIIKKKGQKAKWHRVGDRQFWLKLKQKLLEEVNEFLKDANIEELADVLEVIDTICAFKGFSREKLSRIKAKKKKERGGFKKRIILESS